MRDPARIRPMLEALACAWEASSDLRLGQLIENAREASGSRAPTFAIEDDVMLCGIAGLRRLTAATPDACKSPPDGRVVWDGQVGAWFVEVPNERIGPCPVDEADEGATPSVIDLLARAVAELVREGAACDKAEQRSAEAERVICAQRAMIEKIQDQALARVRALTAALAEALDGWGAWVKTRPTAIEHQDRIAELRKLTGTDEP